MNKKGILFILLLTALMACKPDQEQALPENTLFVPVIPEHFSPPSFPSDNAFSTERYELGKKLFYDPRLSRTLEISCASCHLPELAFSDQLATSPGVEKRAGTRNVPPLFNLAWHPYYTREGGVATLEMQVLVPVQEHNEFDFNILEIQKRLENDPEYQNMAQNAYGRSLDYYVITRALANFERALISGNSRYDHFLKGEVQLTPEEDAGKELFFSSKTNCSSCHGGFNFTDYRFANNGLYTQYADPGRKRLTGQDNDLALFKTPSLRNLAYTAPYMHDGSKKDLHEVLHHYNQGGAGHLHQSDLVRPLHLTTQEIESLIQFLETLNDASFTKNNHYRP